MLVLEIKLHINPHKHVVDFRIEYFDELAMETGEAAASPMPGAKNVYEPAAIALKNIRMYEVTVCCEEFPECHRTFSKTSSSDSSSPGNYKVSAQAMSTVVGITPDNCYNGVVS